MTLTTEGGESIRSNQTEHLIPVLPEISTSPNFIRVTCSSVTVIWPRWTVSKDLGTPPIVQYIPYYRESSSVNWTSGGIVTDSETEDEYQFTFHDLTADSIYEFCVVVVREGVGGEGDKVKIRRQNTAYCSGKIDTLFSNIVLPY
ncbi:hypothetical protein HOLleu_14418 [Holothuria leucospilota]|uniref:Fibronectin type-III domain-containing protein n=1 Tax=Holothuria leucospilota TaxID=206669 RepID=A0A9Q1C8M7_HOLLE|nr:hypothetical protein HOLleu_14418 [Holothuria leucospilota]